MSTTPTTVASATRAPATSAGVRVFAQAEERRLHEAAARRGQQPRGERGQDQADLHRRARVELPIAEQQRHELRTEQQVGEHARHHVPGHARQACVQAVAEHVAFGGLQSVASSGSSAAAIAIPNREIGSTYSVCAYPSAATALLARNDASSRSRVLEQLHETPAGDHRAERPPDDPLQSRRAAIEVEPEAWHQPPHGRQLDAQLRGASDRRAPCQRHRQVGLTQPASAARRARRSSRRSSSTGAT